MLSCKYLLWRVSSLLSLWTKLESSIQHQTTSNLIRTTSDSSSVGTPSNDRPVSPIFRLNATALAVKDIMNNSPTFRANFALFARDSPTSSLLYYPFDRWAYLISSKNILGGLSIWWRYFAEVSLFAQDAITNETVGVIFGKTRGIALYDHPFYFILFKGY